MKVKRYIGENSQDAIQKVKLDLGRDAIILSTRKIRRKGLLGFFMKPLVEVVATIDIDNSKEYPPNTKKRNDIEDVRPLQLQNEFNNEFLKSLDAIRSSEDTAIKNEVNQIKNMVSKMYESISNEKLDGRLSEISNELIKRLEDSDISRTIVEEIKKELVEKEEINHSQDEEAIKKQISAILQRYIVVTKEDMNDKKEQKIIMFVGPTGVGKTTTLAKLAADMVLNEKKNVGVITSDTYRISAVEQLKTYCEIIGVPLSIVYSPNEFSDVINNYHNKDIILVDTAGRSHKDKYQLLELKSLISANFDYDIYLVMSATTKYSDCMEIVNSYSFLNDYKLIFTKLDETSSYGTILNVSHISKKELCYFTTGQSVPDDIEKADSTKIIKCILGERLYERSS